MRGTEAHRTLNFRIARILKRKKMLSAISGTSTQATDVRDAKLSTDPLPTEPPDGAAVPSPSEGSRKKARLSLKSKAEDGSHGNAAQRKITCMFTPPTTALDKVTDGFKGVKEEEIITEEIQEEVKVSGVKVEGLVAERTVTAPCVAALHNLGNTCYLNSVLQVLRYTPGFVDHIVSLTRHVRQTQEDQARLNDESDDDEVEESLACNMVLCLNELFRRMASREESYRKGETPFIALRPYDIVDTLQKLNVLFEGGEQQDSHEVLLCLLGYVQDAAKLINKTRQQLACRVTPRARTTADQTMAQLDGTSDEKGGETRRRGARPRKTSVSDGTTGKTPDLVTKKSLLSTAANHGHLAGDGADGLNKMDKKAHTLLNFLTVTKGDGRSEDVCKSTVKLMNGTTGDLQDLSSGTLTELQNMQAPKVRQRKNQPKTRNTSQDGPCEALENMAAPPANCSPDTSPADQCQSEESTGLQGVRSKKRKLSDKHGEERSKKTKAKVPSLSPSQPVSTAEQSKRLKRLGMTGRTVNKLSISQAKPRTDTTALPGDVRVPCKPDTEQDVASPHPPSNRTTAQQPQSQPFMRKQTARKSFGVERRLIHQALSQRACVELERCSVPVERCSVPVEAVIPPLTEPVTDRIQDMFTGCMALRTKCLECEQYTERREDYQALTVPIPRKSHPPPDDTHSDDEEGEEGGSGATWLVSSLHQVERVTGDNKFKCDRCLHLVEVERSCHVLTTPSVLMLHQIRFAALSSCDGSLSKISDYKSTPLVMPCILDGCQPSCSVPRHRYELYAVITHTGISLSSGHYVAYLRAPPSSFTPPPPVSETPGPGTEAGPPEIEVSVGGRERGSVDKVVWYECDDKDIRGLTQAEMDYVLSPEGTGTPYLLFYWPLLTHNTPVNGRLL